MKEGARIAAAIELLTTLNEAWVKGERAPADAVLAQYFRGRRYIGAKDRGAIAELVYYILRHGATLEWWLEKTHPKGGPRGIVILALVFFKQAHIGQFAEWFDGSDYCPAPLTEEERTMIALYAGKELIHGNVPEPARLNYPDWMGGRLHDLFGEKLYLAMEAMNHEAPVDIRVNTLKASRQQVLDALAAEGFVVAATHYAPHGIRLTKRGALFATQAFRDGWFEMQDEGSQLVASLVEAGAKQKVIDFCAGAGGKTLAIAATMSNKGRILAWDVSDARLSQLPKRLTRAGVDNVQARTLTSESDPFIKRHKESADWVLLDVPCTGTGTWRRNPDLKWRTEEKDLAEMTAIQQRILESAARLVKPGGRLIYATCSLFEEENEGRIEAFLSAQGGFTIEPVTRPNIPMTAVSGGFLRLFPHQHDTDGFFAAVLKKK